MKKLYCVIFGVLTVCFLFGGGILFSAGNGPVIADANRREVQPAVMGKQYSLWELQEDYDQFRKFIFYELPKPFANGTEVRQLFQVQSRLLHDRMSELEFYRVLNPIVVALHCGHTSLAFSKEYQEIRASLSTELPITVKVIHQKAYVFHDLGTGIPRGSEILAINGRTVPEILYKLMANVTADGTNETFKVVRLNQDFNWYYFNFVDCSNQFVVDFLDRVDQKRKTIILKAINREQFTKAFSRFLPQKESDKANYFSEFFSDYALLRIKTFGFRDVATIGQFKSFIDGFFKELSDKNLDQVILDLRNNGGGDVECAAYLYSYLIPKATPFFTSSSSIMIPGLKFNQVKPANNRFTGKLYILINGGSFSSTGLLVSLLKYHQVGRLIGEESGGSYITASNKFQTRYSLNHTHLSTVKITTSVETAVSGLTRGRGVYPDHEVKSTIEDYLGGRDVEMEYTVGLIRQNAVRFETAQKP